LVLAGKADPLYGAYLSLLTKAHGLEKLVHRIGSVSAVELEDLYRSSQAFVCASRHEGFCIPLVEAMQRGLPVFALPTTGVRGTLGHSGVRLASRSARDFAHLVHAGLAERESVEAIVTRQGERLAELSAWHNAGRIRSLCTSLLPGQSAADTPEAYL